MLHRIDRIAGNLSDFPVGSRRLERIPIDSGAMGKRLVRLATSLGDVGLLFSDESRLRDGDVLLADDSCVVAVSVLPDDVLVAYPASVGEAAELGHALGNRHIPLIRDGETLVIAYNSVLETLLARMNVRYARTARVLEQPFAHAAAPHTHE